MIGGGEHATNLPAMSDSSRSVRCWVGFEGWAHRSTPSIISESITSPARSLRARWNASHSYNFMILKFGPLSISLIITGAICGGLGGGLRVPKVGKSAAEPT